MERFSKAAFDAADEASRSKLCVELGALLHRRLAGESEFHRGVRKLILELRGLGHELWSFDESDDMEAWAPNYEDPTGPGIVVTFTPDEVTVEYSKA